MALNSKDKFDSSAVQLAEFAKAISHPARVAILRILAARQSCICGEIVEVLPLAQATVSQHLKELKAIGLISGEIDGVRSCYCINWPVFEQFADLFRAFDNKLSVHKIQQNCC
jgi:ArsR family transcriptional regulator, arsenate/arsenite/antimonite-responsive transcriptional repressor